MHVCDGCLRWLPLLLVLWPAIQASYQGLQTNAQDSLHHCFTRTSRRSVDNTPPIAEYTRVSAVKCMRECILAAGNLEATICKSFVYERYTRKCRLYAHDGNEIPAIIFPANGEDFYIRISEDGACGGQLVFHPNRNPNNFKILRPKPSVLPEVKKVIKEEIKESMITDSPYEREIMPVEPPGTEPFPPSALPYLYNMESVNGPSTPEYETATPPLPQATEHSVEPPPGPPTEPYDVHEPSAPEATTLDQGLYHKFLADYEAEKGQAPVFEGVKTQSGSNFNDEDIDKFYEEREKTKATTPKIEDSDLVDPYEKVKYPKDPDDTYPTTTPSEPPITVTEPEEMTFSLPTDIPIPDQETLNQEYQPVPESHEEMKILSPITPTTQVPDTNEPEEPFDPQMQDNDLSEPKYTKKNSIENFAAGSADDDTPVFDYPKESSSEKSTMRSGEMVPKSETHGYPQEPEEEEHSTEDGKEPREAHHDGEVFGSPPSQKPPAEVDNDIHDFNSNALHHRGQRAQDSSEELLAISRRHLVNEDHENKEDSSRAASEDSHHISSSEIVDAIEKLGMGREVEQNEDSVKSISRGGVKVKKRLHGHKLFHKSGWSHKKPEDLFAEAENMLDEDFSIKSMSSGGSKSKKLTTKPTRRGLPHDDEQMKLVTLSDGEYKLGGHINDGEYRLGQHVIDAANPASDIDRASDMVGTAVMVGKADTREEREILEDLINDLRVDPQVAPAMEGEKLHYGFYEKHNKDGDVHHIYKLVTLGDGQETNANKKTVSSMRPSVLHDGGVVQVGGPKVRKPKKKKKVIPMPIKEDCKVGYYVVIGNQLIDPSHNEDNMQSFYDVEQGDCASLCTQGLGPNGETVRCQSLNYLPLSQKCEMYDMLSEPHGPGTLVENEKSIFAEKFCMSRYANECDPEEVFILHVEKTMHTKPFKMVIGRSINYCLDKCLEYHNCMSVVFDSERTRCKLYSKRVADNMHLVVDAKPGVVLIENGCRRPRNADDTARRARGADTFEQQPQRRSKGKKQDRSRSSEDQDDQWSEWSGCDYKVQGVRLRARIKKCNGVCAEDRLDTKEC